MPRYSGAYAAHSLDIVRRLAIVVERDGYPADFVGASLSCSGETVRRWLRGERSPQRTRWAAIEEFIEASDGGAFPPSEVARVLTVLDESTDPRQRRTDTEDWIERHPAETATLRARRAADPPPRPRAPTPPAAQLALSLTPPPAPHPTPPPPSPQTATRRGFGRGLRRALSPTA